MSVRVLIADDHPVFLEGLRVLLDTVPEITVVGAARDGRELLSLAADTAADVAVVDLDMPELDGVAATALLRERHPGLAVLMLTMHDDTGSLRRALAAGARGYVLKGAGHGAIARAVLSIADGDTVLTGAVGRAVLDAAVRDRGPRLPGLTEREHDVLDLVVAGHGNAEIARRLSLSTKSVQNYVSNLLTKLDASSRARLVDLAREGQGAHPFP
jgi:DNA-binding NarL/FixJ family response regulator